MASNRQNYTTISFEIRRDQHARLKLLYPRFGQLSKVLRHLVDEVLKGKIKIKN
jgi:hypothetical protein